MATLKICINQKSANENGTYNIKIRLTHNRKNVYIGTAHYITEREINKKTREIKDCPQKDYAYRDLIMMRDEISRISNMITNMDASTLADRLKIAVSGQKMTSISVVQFWKDYVSQMKDDNKASYKNYQAALNHLESFAKRDIYTHDVTVKFLEEFEAWIDRNVGGVRSTSLYMASFRKIFNEIRNRYNDEDLNVIVVSNNPFSRYKVPKQQRSASGERALSIKTIRKIYSLELQRKTDIFARDMFMFSFFTCGMNSTDIYDLSPKDIKADIMTYERNKTRDRRHDKAEIKIYLEPEALEILNRYKIGKEYDFKKRYSAGSNMNRQLNLYLKRIGARIGEYDLTFYHARHSWATIAANECNISKDDIALALNHVSESHSITERYIRKDFSRIQKANQAVIKKIRVRK